MVTFVSLLTLIPALISQDLDRLKSPLHELRSLSGTWVSQSFEYNLARYSPSMELRRTAMITFGNEGRTMSIQEQTLVEKDKPYVPGTLFVVHAAYDWKSTRAFMFGDPSDDPIKLKATWDGNSLTLENPSISFTSAGTPENVKGTKIGNKHVLRMIDGDRWEMDSEMTTFGVAIRQKVVYIRQKS